MKIIKSVLCALLLAGIAAHAQTVDINVTPTSGIESVTPKVTWTSTGVTSCTATGGWSGTKATSGTETLPAIDRSASYGLVCATAAGDAVLSWTPPTQNTNGTPLTDLTKYRIYMSATADLLGSSLLIELPAPASTYIAKNLPTGPKVFGIVAVNSGDVMSVMSSAASKTISGASATDQTQVGVTPRPKAVTGLAAQ